MITKRKPAETFHPGVFLEEELEARGWSQIDLAEILGRPPRLISEIISGKRSISPETALGLADAFGTSAELWMNLETSFQLAQAEQKEDVPLKAKLYSKFPVREMIKRHWIKPSENIEVLVSRFCDFFEISSLDEKPEFDCAYRKSTSYDEDNTTYQCAWLYRAKKLAKACLVEQKFSQAKLKTCLEKLRLLLHEPQEVRHIPKILADAGIRFIIVEPLPKSKIDGATFWLDDNSPVIVMSLRYDRIDNFWFTLIHELIHVKNEDKKDGVIIDIDLLGDEISGDKPEYEIRADEEAAEFLIPIETLDSFILRTHPYYLEWKIQGFAANNKVHPGIVVGQLHNRYVKTGKGLPHSHLRKLLAKVRDIIIEPALTDGYGYIPSV
jgi:HTH-type transcriptional regulator / antitoxin HigA